MVVRRNWEREEVRAALALYLRTPFGRIHNRNPEIIRLAAAINRTASAVALKMSNLAALDESLPRKGMQNASAMDKRVWEEFLEQPEFVVSSAKLFKKPDLSYVQSERNYDDYHLREGTEATREVKQRGGQDFFREMILSSYGGRCALTGVDAPQLLVASHIIGWAESKKLRLRPENGICLNALHDKAFDRHLITFDQNYRMLISDRLPAKARSALMNVEQTSLRMPEKFLPAQSYLAQHHAKFQERREA